ncbi:serine/threonine protein kinase, partial [Streptomyces fuscigenes]|nr:serine/threonine protein kinase [Streptomyces fuscigenes]
ATAAVLLVAGVGYALGMGGGHPDTTGSGATSGAPTTQADGAAAAADGDGTGAAAGQAVTVGVTGTNTAYSGPCPPSAQGAPAFTATFQVPRLPMQFSFRWVSAGGEVVDPRWHTLSFPAGGPHSHQETIRVTTYAKDGALHSAMGVEIQSPLHALSDTVPFSLTCTDTADGAAFTR